jgi:hypothetical protein
LLSLWFSFSSNRFNTSWTRPFFIIFIVALLISIIRSANSEITVSDSLVTLLNPLKPFKELLGTNGQKTSSTQEWWYLLYSVFYSTMLYQLISAFRKPGKS